MYLNVGTDSQPDLSDGCCFVQYTVYCYLIQISIKPVNKEDHAENCL